VAQEVLDAHQVGIGVQHLSGHGVTFMPSAA
jgi:hypothetical protein